MNSMLLLGMIKFLPIVRIKMEIYCRSVHGTIPCCKDIHTVDGTTYYFICGCFLHTTGSLFISLERFVWHVRQPPVCHQPCRTSVPLTAIGNLQTGCRSTSKLPSNKTQVPGTSCGFIESTRNHVFKTFLPLFLTLTRKIKRQSD